MINQLLTKSVFCESAALVIPLESLGPLLLVVGAGARPVALGLAGLMVGAIATVRASHGFFMNRQGAQQGEGFEHHLLVIGLSLALVLGGGGRWSLDQRFWKASSGKA